MTTAKLEQPHNLVAQAARGFERRWTLRALLAVDKELYHTFREQQQLWHEAMFEGQDIAYHTACMCRGWKAIADRMEEAGVEDDAYMIGIDPHSGTHVAIGDQLAARERVRELHGDKCIWITPAEVATMLGSMQALRELKAIFPGAELSVEDARVCSDI